MDLDYKAIGQRIRKQREHFGYSREKLAELLGVTPKFCSDIELGVKGFSLQTLNKIVRILKLSPDYILYGSQEKNNLTTINQMLMSCDRSQLKYAEELLSVFIQATVSKSH